MKNATETLEVEVEEKEMPTGLKIGLLSLGFILSLATLYFTIDIGSVGNFFDEHHVKSAFMWIAMTALVVIGFNLYRAIFGHDEHTKKHAEEILLSGIHFNYPALVLLPDKYLKGIEIDTKEAKQFHNYYIYGLVMLSIIIMTAVVPVCNLLSKKFEGGVPDGYTVTGEPYNYIAIAFYALGRFFQYGVVFFWVISFIFGLKRIPEGSKGLLEVNAVPLGRKKYGSGWVLTFPFLFKSIELKIVEEMHSLRSIYNANTEPEILTASAQSALYDKNLGDKLRPEVDGVGDKVRFKDDTLHEDRRSISYLDMTVVFELGDQLIFFEKHTSIEKAKKDLMTFVEGARLETFGNLTYAQITGKTRTAENRMMEAIDLQLKGYGGGCFKVTNVEINKIDFKRVTKKDGK